MESNTTAAADQKPTSSFTFGNSSQRVPDGEGNEVPVFSFSCGGGGIGSEEFQKMCETARILRQEQEKEKERLSLFNNDGSAKSLEEITKIGIEKQWLVIRKWLDVNFPIGPLVWRNEPLFKENIDRLEAMNFKGIDGSLSRFQYVSTSVNHQ